MGVKSFILMRLKPCWRTNLRMIDIEQENLKTLPKWKILFSSNFFYVFFISLNYFQIWSSVEPQSRQHTTLDTHVFPNLKNIFFLTFIGPLLEIRSREMLELTKRRGANKFLEKSTFWLALIFFQENYFVLPTLLLFFMAARSSLITACRDLLFSRVANY